MASAIDFNALVERAMQVGNRSHMRPVVEKELLHFDLLFALDQAGLLDLLTFQGGTSLRLCYGARRFSEDLDFAGGRDFSTIRMLNMKSCIQRYVGERYGLEVTVKEPKELAQRPEHRNVQVHKWQIRVVTAPARPDLPTQMIKIEVANIPAYTRMPQQLRQNYNFLPDGYSDLVIMVESLDEIMADKLVALVDCTAYIRHRDIWDLHWLQQQGAKIDGVLVRNKLRDYGAADYDTKVKNFVVRLPGIIHGKDFRDQMSRFIPLDVQQGTLLKEKFLTLLENETVALLGSAAQLAGGVDGL
jgi:predicted nucleotidyltransferase component of viral defense system